MKPKLAGSNGKRTADASLSSSESLGEAVYKELRRRISRGDLGPGERLREVELANELGVSRTPVREALKQLKSDGLLNYLGSRGATIAELTPQQAIELYTLREVLEGAAARLAAQHALDPEIDILKAHLHQQKEAGEDPQKLAELNRHFHQTIYRLTHNRYLIDVLGKTQDYMVLLQRTAYMHPGRSKSAYKEHADIVDAIARHDPDAAEAASRRHSREAQRIRMMLEFGDGGAWS
ncbi:MAG: GntR family transcriptional regulator [Hyphomicrobiales bacterium]